MGCDIHLIAERNSDVGWQYVPGPIIKCWRCEPAAPEPSCYWCKGIGAERDAWFSDRAYAIFSILAGVRGDLPPIAQPRGLPFGLTATAVHELDNDCGDMHSASWLTLAEVFTYNWAQHPDDWGLPLAVTETARTFLARMRQLHATCEVAAADIRIVFNFDN